MKVKVDLQLCESHGECCFVAPEVFTLDENDELAWTEAPDDALRAKVVQAAAVCPTRAITVEG